MHGVCDADCAGLLKADRTERDMPESIYNQQLICLGRCVFAGVYPRMLLETPWGAVSNSLSAIWRLHGVLGVKEGVSESGQRGVCIYKVLCMVSDTRVRAWYPAPTLHLQQASFCTALLLHAQGVSLLYKSAGYSFAIETF